MSDSNRVLFYDYARFFAIFGVVAVHSYQINNEGFIPSYIYNFGRFGVLLFFMVSGSTVWITYNSIIERSRSPIKVFYLRRFFRIVPLFIFMGIYYSIFDGYHLFDVFSPSSGLHPVNLNLIKGAWSIWNEMYFYLLFPMYFYIRRSNFLFTLLLIIFCFISFSINLRELVGNFPESNLNDFDYFNFFTQFICFVVGVEYAAKNFLKTFVAIFTYVILGTAFKLYYFSDFLMVADNGAVHWTGIISFICLVFLMVIKFVTESKKFNHNNFISKVFIRVGRVTYTSYMVHFIIIDVLKEHINSFSAELNVIIVAVITFSLSILIQKYTEEVWQKIGRDLSMRYLN
jgi:exopolysaccharide production protein ExoZ